MLLPLLATATALALDVGCSVMLCAGLPSSVRSRSGQRCSLCRAGDLCVLATARHIHICLRVAVLRDSSRFRGLRPAAAPTVTALGTSGRVRRVKSALGFATVPHGDAPASFARHPRRDAVSPEYRLLASLAPVGAIREPHLRVSLRSALGHSPRFLTTY